jgi:hypothetical protein
VKCRVATSNNVLLTISLIFDIYVPLEYYPQNIVQFNKSFDLLLLLLYDHLIMQSNDVLHHLKLARCHFLFSFYMSLQLVAGTDNSLLQAYSSNKLSLFSLHENTIC